MPPAAELGEPARRRATDSMTPLMPARVTGWKIFSIPLRVCAAWPISLSRPGADGLP